MVFARGLYGNTKILQVGQSKGHRLASKTQQTKGGVLPGAGLSNRPRWQCWCPHLLPEAFLLRPCPRWSRQPERLHHPRSGPWGSRVLSAAAAPSPVAPRTPALSASPSSAAAAQPAALAPTLLASLPGAPAPPWLEPPQLLTKLPPPECW